MIGNRDQLGRIGFAMMAGILFFLQCCLIENYAEFSQAVFVPFILFVVAGSRAQTILSASAAVAPVVLPEASYGVAAPPLPS
jgi:hypothetical protein